MKEGHPTEICSVFEPQKPQSSDTQEGSNQMLKLAPFKVKEQQFYFKLSQKLISAICICRAPDQRNVDQVENMSRLIKQKKKKKSKKVTLKKPEQRVKSCSLEPADLLAGYIVHVSDTSGF